LDLQVADDYLHIHQLRSQSAWIKGYWSAYGSSDLNALTNTREASSGVWGTDFYKDYANADSYKNILTTHKPVVYRNYLSSLLNDYKKITPSVTLKLLTDERLNDPTRFIIDLSDVRAPEAMAQTELPHLRTTNNFFLQALAQKRTKTGFLPMLDLFK
jgi:hypothetical protein